ERVLVTDWVDGMQFDEILALDQDARDRFGEIVYRFSFGSIYHLRHLNADAHPGNYMLMDDGRVAFIDFGMTKRITESQLRLQVAVARAALENDPEAVAAALEEIGFIRDRTRIDTGMLLEHVKAVGGWYLNGRKTRITSKLVARTIAAMSDPRSQYFSLVRRESLPADELLVRRMETGVLAVLGKLNAAANWTKIGGEWWDADKPATPLGREEWEFFQSRGHVRERLG
ncbi:MAG TPA: AarF/UbiB family protein, partial [Solirubrobacterales bacterium]|nr:AarF/UbiB family protein [Solirubrobacterales bacterium]